jgi:hypothetical protein
MIGSKENLNQETYGNKKMENTRGAERWGNKKGDAAKKGTR